MLQINVSIQYKKSAESQIVNFVNTFRRRNNKVNIKFINKDSEDDMKIYFIKNQIEKYFDIPLGTIDDPSRKEETVRPRQIAMYFSKEMTKKSLCEIGSHICNRDHATVISSIQTVNNLIDTDKKFREDIENLRNILI